MAETIVKLIEAVEGGKKAPLGVYHYTNEGEATWHEFAKAIYEEGRGLGIITKDRAVIPCATEEHPTKAKRPAYSVLDKTKIKDALGIEIPEWKARRKIDSLIRNITTSIYPYKLQSLLCSGLFGFFLL